LRRISSCFSLARGRFGFRLIEFSIQGNHLHLVVEADDHVALTRGVQGLSIRIARALNAMMGRGGKVFDDHYHSRLLRSPTELLNAIRYVLGNASHHFGERSVDAFSSAGISNVRRTDLVSEPRSWLLREGFKRARISLRI